MPGTSCPNKMLYCQRFGRCSIFAKHRLSTRYSIDVFYSPISIKNGDTAFPRRGQKKEYVSQKILIDVVGHDLGIITIILNVFVVGIEWFMHLHMTQLQWYCASCLYSSYADYIHVCIAARSLEYWCISLEKDQNTVIPISFQSYHI